MGTLSASLAPMRFKAENIYMAIFTNIFLIPGVIRANSRGMTMPG